MEQFNIPRGVNIMIGRPALPMSPEKVAALAGAVATVPGIIEAHLPQCRVPSLSAAPAQVLVLVLRSHRRAGRVMLQLQPLLHEILPAGVTLDVWPLDAGSTLLPAIRSAGCQLNAGPQSGHQRRWWQFWR